MLGGGDGWGEVRHERLRLSTPAAQPARTPYEPLFTPALFMNLGRPTEARQAFQRSIRYGSFVAPSSINPYRREALLLEIAVRIEDSRAANSLRGTFTLENCP